MKTLALAAIRLYQRFISPRKGFSCAYRLHTGRAGCSALGYRVIQRYGVWKGIAVLQKRLEKCGVAHRRYFAGRTVLHRQAGFCDLSCDVPCDLDASAACDVLSSCGDACSCGDLWPSRKKREEERWVNIPPNGTQGKSSARRAE